MKYLIASLVMLIILLLSILVREKYKFLFERGNLATIPDTNTTSQTTETNLVFISEKKKSKKSIGKNKTVLKSKSILKDKAVEMKSSKKSKLSPSKTDGLKKNSFKLKSNRSILKKKIF